MIYEMQIYNLELHVYGYDHRTVRRARRCPR